MGSWLTVGIGSTVGRITLQYPGTPNVLEVQPGVAAAWAPLRSLGVTGNLSYVSSSVVDVSWTTLLAFIGMRYYF